MFKHGTALLAAAAALIAAAPAAADQFSLDLANPPGTIRIPISPGTEVSVLVVNRLPQARYTVIAQLESIPIDPLTPIAIPQLHAFGSG